VCPQADAFDPSLPLLYPDCYHVIITSGVAPWSPSPSPHVDLEVTGLGLSMEGILSPSPRSQALQHRTITQVPLGSPPHQCAGIIEGQFNRMRYISMETRVSRALAPSPYRGSGVSDLRAERRSEAVDEQCRTFLRLHWHLALTSRLVDRHHSCSCCPPFRRQRRVARLRWQTPAHLFSD
jgi:hypothetical protein